MHSIWVGKRVLIFSERELSMKKWTFWISTCLVSILNGAAFFSASLNSMQQGIDGADNQAALLFVPLLWIAAALVLVGLNVYTLMRGMAIEKGQTICVSGIFDLYGLSRRAAAGRISFFVMTCLLMLFGYSLFASETILSIAYALSGGVLLLFLYVWKMSGLQGAMQQHAS